MRTPDEIERALRMLEFVNVSDAPPGFGPDLKARGQLLVEVLKWVKGEPSMFGLLLGAIENVHAVYEVKRKASAN